MWDTSCNSSPPISESIPSRILSLMKENVPAELRIDKTTEPLDISWNSIEASPRRLNFELSWRTSLSPSGMLITKSSRSCKTMLNVVESSCTSMSSSKTGRPMWQSLL